jgi:NTP pyrophosphatase (non-canonical NTP hydrolase)
MAANFHDFQDRVRTLSAQAWPDYQPGPDLAAYLVALLCEETGELAQAVRKLGERRWGHPDEHPGSADAVLKELGDVLFLAARLADLAGVRLEDAARGVLAKIEARLVSTT